MNSIVIKNELYDVKSFNFSFKCRVYKNKTSTGDWFYVFLKKDIRGKFDDKIRFIKYTLNGRDILSRVLKLSTGKAISLPLEIIKIFNIKKSDIIEINISESLEICTNSQLKNLNDKNKNVLVYNIFKKAKTFVINNDKCDDGTLKLSTGINLHKFFSNQNNTKKIKLLFGNDIHINNTDSKLILTPEKAGLIAWLCTDGHAGAHKVKNNNRKIRQTNYLFRIDEEDPIVVKYFCKLSKDVYNVIPKFRFVDRKNCFEVGLYNRHIVEDILLWGPSGKSSRSWSIPIQNLGQESMREFLKVFFTAEGRKPHRYYITASSVNFEGLCQVRDMLKYYFDIDASIGRPYYNFLIPKNCIVLEECRYYVLFKSLEDNKIIKKYKTKAYDICICSRKNIIKFYNEIGYISGSKKDNKLNSIINSFMLNS